MILEINIIIFMETVWLYMYMNVVQLCVYQFCFVLSLILSLIGLLCTFMLSPEEQIKI